MQTHFSLAQLAHADIAEADKILRDCVHCGMCLATCPTYLLLGDERDSPRGRIYLIKDMLEKDEGIKAETVRHLDRCLACLACETTCPSGVDYRRLLDIGQERIGQGFKRTYVQRWARWFLHVLLPKPRLLRAVLKMARFVSFLKPVMPWLENIPSSLPEGEIAERSFPLLQPKRGKVLLLLGCAQQVLRPSINEAAVELLHHLGIEVVQTGSLCCGAISHHLGYREEAKNHARALLQAFRQTGAEAILSTTSGCASVMQDYRHWLGEDAPVQEISLYLQRSSAELKKQGAALPPLAYHTPCSLRHGLKIPDLPKELLQKAGYQLIDMPEQHLCCGSAGTYHLLEPALAEQLQKRKKDLLLQMKAEAFVSANIGCLEQMDAMPGFHYIELLNWAQTGRKPQGWRVK